MQLQFFIHCCVYGHWAAGPRGTTWIKHYLDCLSSGHFALESRLTSNMLMSRSRALHGGSVDLIHLT